MQYVSTYKATLIVVRSALLTMFYFNAVAQPDSFPALHGNYLGQTRPGDSAIVFAKGIVSTDVYEHSAAIFSRDGNILLWGTVDRNKPGALMEMRRIGNTWTKPATPSFAQNTYDDMYPFFSVDGSKLYFGSRRPLPSGSPAGDIRIWVIERTAAGWGTPTVLDTTLFHGFEYAHSVSKNGDLYFSAREPVDNKFKWSIYCAKYSNGKYLQPEKLDTCINNGWYVDGPCISPDENFLVFESDRPGGIGSIDLYICFRQKNNSWGLPINMGPKVNTGFAERFAGLSPDGKYFFFGSNRASALPDIYWIKADFIDDLKRK